MLGRNRIAFNEIVHGRFGRKIAYTDVDKIDESNVVKVVGSVLGVFDWNKRAIEYLYNYYKGDQPVLYRQKTIRDDVNNRVVENHAYEVVQFKVSQSYGEPIQIVALKNDETINKAVEQFNAYTRAANKPVKDIAVGIWQSATGTAYKGIQFTGKKDLPFRFVCLNPMNTLVIYSRQTGEPMAAMQELKDADGRYYKLVYTENQEFRIQDSKLLDVGTNENGEIIYSKLHGFAGIPIVEYPNNADRISDIELIISLLDAINNMQSNRMDSIEQFVQSWIKFINCDIDPETFEKLKMQGAISVKSNGENKKVDVEIMSQELNQTESQIAKKDLWDNALSISAIPNKEGNTGGDTQGAVELRNGWDFSKQRAKLKDPFIIEAERKMDAMVLNSIRVLGNDDCPLTQFDYDVQINHSPTDNMLVKTQALSNLLSSGIHPLIALSTIGLFEDPQHVFGESKPYMDAIYRTADEIAKEQVADYDEQKAKAKQILDKQHKEQAEQKNALKGNKNGNNNEK